MNLFVTDRDPGIAARNLDDKRVVKLVTECGQMLSTALRIHGIEDDKLYRKAWMHHPVTKWVAANKSNFIWCLEHALELSFQYTIRYNRVHSTESVLQLASCYLDTVQIPDSLEIIQFQNSAANVAFDLDFRNEDDVVIAYRKYLNVRWKRDARRPTWTGVLPPEWKED